MSSGRYEAVPPSLVVGVGASRGAPVEEVLGLIVSALGDAGLSPASVAELATVGTKAGEPGIVEAAERLGVPLVTHSAEVLAAVTVPHPCGAPLAALGTPSVAEAAALVRGGELLVPKRKSERAGGRPSRVTCAVVRRPGRGRPAVAGLGPGSGAEEGRARTAVEEARKGPAVAPTGSGAAGVHAMASPTPAETCGGTDVVGVPGGKERYEEAVRGGPRTHCDPCGYGIDPPGFEDGGGVPRQRHLGPDGHGHRQHGAHSHAH